MGTLVQDFRYALRQLRKSPAFAMAAVLTLGLGIGANTATFSVMNAVLLRSLPVSQPDRVYNLRIPTGKPDGDSNTGNSDTSFSLPIFQALREQTDVFTELIAAAPLSIGKTSIRFGSEPELASGELVSGNFFSGLGVPIARGRGFTMQDETEHAPVAVLSYRFWTSRFNRDPDVIGKVLYVKGVPLTVVGISAEGFDGLERGVGDTDFWIPLQDRAELNAWGNAPEDGKTFYGQPRWWCLLLTARLAPGVTPQQAETRLQGLFQAKTYEVSGQPKPGTKKVYLQLTPAKGLESYSSDYKQPLYLLTCLVGLVLFIACANVALLLIARNQARQREFSLRLAIGAGRMHLFRQLLTESLLLVVGGGVLAWIFAVTTTRVLAAWAQIDTNLQPDHTVLFFTLSVLVLAAVGFGLVPLHDALSTPAGLALKTSSAAATQDGRRSRLGRVVVVLQMALCIVLLVSACLLLRTLHNLENVPLGMRTQGLIVFGVDPQGSNGKEETIQFYQRLLARLRVLPGVESVSLAENRPGSGWSNNNIPVVDGAKPQGSSESYALTKENNVGPDFFHVMGIPVLMGRGITGADTEASPRVVVINQVFAERFLANQNPIGHQVGSKGEERTIVGVVGNHKYTGIEEKDIPMMWIPYTQLGGGGVGTMHAEMRVQGDPLAAFPNVERAVHEIDPNLPLRDPRTQQEQFEQSISGQRLFSRLASFFGLVAGLLVATGLYGTLAYRVSHRTVEIGVRMALGAQRGQVLWMVLGESMVLAGVGLAIGFPLAVLTARLLRSMLFGVQPSDAWSFVAALLLLVAVALCASVIPARRAANTEPLQALRSE